MRDGLTRRLLAVGAALLLAGCSGRLRSEDPATRDQEILRDILWGLHHDPRLGAVLPSCLDGAVVLRGAVPSGEAREEAERIAWGVRSVREVANHLEVRPK